MSYSNSATISLASAGQASGVVTSIGVTPSSSNGTTSFPVVLTVTSDHGALYSGTSADVQIVVANRQDVLSVPTSAIQTNGRTTSVSLLTDGHLLHRHIQVGVEGPMRTQILSGLAAGQEVVLAAENQPIPSPAGNSGPGGGVTAFARGDAPVFVGGG
jgi:multidrug efflux pump subunit AcrA (membrane-fusion protein)